MTPGTAHDSTSVILGLALIGLLTVPATVAWLASPGPVQLPDHFPEAAGDPRCEPDGPADPLARAGDLVHAAVRPVGDRDLQLDVRFAAKAPDPVVPEDRLEIEFVLHPELSSPVEIRRNRWRIGLLHDREARRVRLETPGRPGIGVRSIDHHETAWAIRIGPLPDVAFARLRWSARSRLRSGTTVVTDTTDVFRGVGKRSGPHRVELGVSRLRWSGNEPPPEPVLSAYDARLAPLATGDRRWTTDLHLSSALPSDLRPFPTDSPGAWILCGATGGVLGKSTALLLHDYAAIDSSGITLVLPTPWTRQVEDLAARPLLEIAVQRAWQRGGIHGEGRLLLVHSTGSRGSTLPGVYRTDLASAFASPPDLRLLLRAAFALVLEQASHVGAILCREETARDLLAELLVRDTARWMRDTESLHLPDAVRSALTSTAPVPGTDDPRGPVLAFFDDLALEGDTSSLPRFFRGIRHVAGLLAEEREDREVRHEHWMPGVLRFVVESLEENTRPRAARLLESLPAHQGEAWFRKIRAREKREREQG